MNGVFLTRLTSTFQTAHASHIFLTVIQLKSLRRWKTVAYNRRTWGLAVSGRPRDVTVQQLPFIVHCR